MSDDFLQDLSDNPLATVAEFYAGCLTANDKAMLFVIEELKLTAEEAAKQQVGFSDRALSLTQGSIVFTCDDRVYRIRGLEKNTSSTTLKVTLQVSRDSIVHLDSLDFVKARSRASFVKAAANELFVDADFDELLYNGEGFEGQPFTMGLIDAAQLQHPASTTKTFWDCESTFRPQVAT